MPNSELTRLIREAFGNRGGASERAFEVVWEQMRRVALRQMRRERPDHTLQPTALANECFLYLRERDVLSIRDRKHFYRLVGQVMRHILINHAKRHQRAKRGCGSGGLSLSMALDSRPAATRDEAALIDLDEALERLHRESPSHYAVIVERFFAGRTFAEIGARLGCSESTARYRYRAALMFLLRALDR